MFRVVLRAIFLLSGRGCSLHILRRSSVLLRGSLLMLRLLLLLLLRCAIAPGILPLVFLGVLSLQKDKAGEQDESQRGGSLYVSHLFGHHCSVNSSESVGTCPQLSL